MVSREEGSGTRDAFTELTGVLADDVDNTVDTAEISNSTSVVIQSVAGNSAAIGYISLGSLDDSVKAVQVDGVDATVENVTSGDYKLHLTDRGACILEKHARKVQGHSLDSDM